MNILLIFGALSVLGILGWALGHLIKTKNGYPLMVLLIFVGIITIGVLKGLEVTPDSSHQEVARCDEAGSMCY